MRPSLPRLNVPLAIGFALIGYACVVAGQTPAEAAPTAYSTTLAQEGSTAAQRRANWLADNDPTNGMGRTGATIFLEDFQSVVFAGANPAGLEFTLSSISSSVVPSNPANAPPTNLFNAGDFEDHAVMTNVGVGAGSGNTFIGVAGTHPSNFGTATTNLQVGDAGGGNTDTLDIVFSDSSGTTAVGFDIWTLNAGFAAAAGTVTLQAFADVAQTTSIATFTITSGTGGYRFFGIVSDVPIAVVSISAVGGGAGLFERIDNLVFNPEPSTFALAALGLAGMAGFVRRRRRRRLSATRAPPDSA